MNRTALWIGLLAAVGLAGAAVWVMDSEAGIDAAEDGQVVDGDEARRGDRGRGPREGRGGGGGGGGGAMARIEALEAEMAALKREVKMLRAVKGVGPTVAALDDGATSDSADFEGAVREIIEHDRKEEREAEDERRRDGMKGMVEETAAELAEAAGLDDEQRESIAGLWQTEADALLPLFTSARNGDRSFPEVRAESEKAREETDAAAKALLTAAQYEKYEELRPRGRRRGPR